MPPGETPSTPPSARPQPDSPPCSLQISSTAASTSAFISRKGTILLSDHTFPSNGMYSMKRTLIGRSTVRRTKSATSSSFTPRINTTLSLTGSKPASSAACSAASTRGTPPSRRASAAKRSGRSVSRLTFNAFKPAADSSGSMRASAMPLEVMPTVEMPGRERSRRTTSTRSRRTVGSPPVKRILLTPPSASSLAIRKISSAVSSRDAGVRSTPSAGIQYVQRRLQRSVRLIRR
mmetsp:Transcript_13857/g.40160  ORF Transcript_13857/g.40160 Transcript_13857/m.40160 type:complete len:234 (-) Transcript_13857:71-772(-)